MIDVPFGPAIVLRWVASFLNIEFDLNTRKFTVSLVKLDLSPPKKPDGHNDQAK